ncbi:hypothetical protein KAR91_34435 [Candidatus Pacearchaeota archaeon]|nr:hypothetical protein [Candidatus Pacearchaeota archaeon]
MAKFKILDVKKAVRSIIASVFGIDESQITFDDDKAPQEVEDAVSTQEEEQEAEAKETPEEDKG